QFSPESFEIPLFTIRHSSNLITGNVKIPLNLQQGKKTPLNLDQPFDLNIRTEKFALATLQPNPNQPQLTGSAELQMQASKTLRNPFVEIRAAARGIRSPAVSSL